MSKIIAVDFDGTLCENDWPFIGKPKTDVINYILNRQAIGDKIILWTCRCDECLEAAVKWCEEHGLYFDAINDNLPEIVSSFGGNSRKIFANEYLDDKNLCITSVDVMYEKALLIMKEHIPKHD